MNESRHIDSFPLFIVSACKTHIPSNLSPPRSISLAIDLVLYALSGFQCCYTYPVSTLSLFLSPPLSSSLSSEKPASDAERLWQFCRGLSSENISSGAPSTLSSLQLSPFIVHISRYGSSYVLCYSSSPGRPVRLSSIGGVLMLNKRVNDWEFPSYLSSSSLDSPIASSVWPLLFAFNLNGFASTPSRSTISA